MHATRRVAGLLAALTLVVLVPTATAHTPIFSADNLVRGSVGLLNEPVSTYAVSGLDLCFTQNTNAPRAVINVSASEASSFTVTLRAPNGAVHTAAVSVPSGRANCLAFPTPLLLTQPGQYQVDLTGNINGTTFNVQNILAGGAVIQRENITFPDSSLPSYTQLQSRIAALETVIASLDDQVQELKADANKDDGQFAPGAPAAFVMIALAGLVALRRGR